MGRYATFVLSSQKRVNITSREGLVIGMLLTLGIMLSISLYLFLSLDVLLSCTNSFLQVVINGSV